MSYDRAWPIIAVAGTLLCAAVEVIHGVVGQPIQLGAILSHSLAIIAGAWVAAITLRDFTIQFRGRERPRLLFLAYTVLMMLWSWRPFVPELSAASISEQFSAVHWMPLRAMAQRVDLFSVADIVTQFLLYLPLGALLAVWPVKRHGPLRGILPALYLSIILELGKIVIAERFFDVTHILIQVAGAAVGWIVVRRSGFTPYGEMGLPTFNRRVSRSRYP
jgi:glycopeptide antibiotics resistance protein